MKATSIIQSRLWVSRRKAESPRYGRTGVKLFKSVLVLGLWVGELRLGIRIVRLHTYLMNVFHIRGRISSPVATIFVEGKLQHPLSSLLRFGVVSALRYSDSDRRSVWRVIWVLGILMFCPYWFLSLWASRMESAAVRDSSSCRGSRGQRVTR